MKDPKLDKVENDLKDHLVECAANYSKLESITQVQNNKLDNQTKRLDELSGDVKNLGKLIVKGSGWVIGTLVTALFSTIAFIANHYL